MSWIIKFGPKMPTLRGLVWSMCSFQTDNIGIVTKPITQRFQFKNNMTFFAHNLVLFKKQAKIFKKMNLHRQFFSRYTNVPKSVHSLNHQWNPYFHMASPVLDYLDSIRSYTPIYSSGHSVAVGPPRLYSFFGPPTS